MRIFFIALLIGTFVFLLGSIIFAIIAKVITDRRLKKIKIEKISNDEVK